MSIIDTISVNVTAILKAKGWSEEQLARKLNMTPDELRGALEGDMGFDDLERIAKVLKVCDAWLLLPGLPVELATSSMPETARQHALALWWGFVERGRADYGDK